MSGVAKDVEALLNSSTRLLSSSKQPSRSLSLRSSPDRMLLHSPSARLGSFRDRAAAARVSPPIEVPDNLVRLPSLHAEGAVTTPTRDGGSSVSPRFSPTGSSSRNQVSRSVTFLGRLDEASEEEDTSGAEGNKEDPRPSASSQSGAAGDMAKLLDSISKSGISKTTSSPGSDISFRLRAASAGSAGTSQPSTASPVLNRSLSRINSISPSATSPRGILRAPSMFRAGSTAGISTASPTATLARTATLSRGGVSGDAAAPLLSPSVAQPAAVQRHLSDPMLHSPEALRAVAVEALQHAHNKIDSSVQQVLRKVKDLERNLDENVRQQFMDDIEVAVRAAWSKAHTDLPSRVQAALDRSKAVPSAASSVSATPTAPSQASGSTQPVAQPPPVIAGGTAAVPGQQAMWAAPTMPANQATSVTPAPQQGVAVNPAQAAFPSLLVPSSIPPYSFTVQAAGPAPTLPQSADNMMPVYPTPPTGVPINWYASPASIPVISHLSTPPAGFQWPQHLPAPGQLQPDPQGQLHAATPSANVSPVQLPNAYKQPGAQSWGQQEHGHMSNAVHAVWHQFVDSPAFSPYNRHTCSPTRTRTPSHATPTRTQPIRSMQHLAGDGHSHQSFGVWGSNLGSLASTNALGSTTITGFTPVYGEELRFVSQVPVAVSISRGNSPR